VHLLTWKGIVNPVMERYIARGLDTAERSDARAAVIKLDTPGGLDSAMRDIIQRIEASRVPVIVYVSPSGGRAASAGTFITMAGHVAAMAPNTSIGAATPISSSGDDIEGALGRKVTNDAVSYIRGIAELRGRNADWAEKAVRDAVSVNQNEAVSLNVIDFVATNLDDLLAKSDGRQVEVQSATGGPRSVTLRTSGAPVFDNGTNFFEELLYRIADPDIAFLLLSLGGLFLISEIFHPTFLAGIVGVVCLILAYFSLGSLPTNWAGVALILFGFALLTAELFVSGFGVLGIGGVVALILGGLILTGGNETGFQVSRWLVFVLAALIGAFLLLFIGSLVRLRRMPAQSGRESLIGKQGTTRTRLDPRGVVWVAGERWDAVAEDPPIEEDTPVIVTETAGLRLHVKRDPASIKLLPAAPVNEA
jgi:membrane-bound serine protease (ClpP class)